MDVNTVITISGFGFSLIVYLLTLAYFTGRYTQNTDSFQAQLTQIAKDRLSDVERIDTLEEKMDGRYHSIDTAVALNTAAVGRMEADLKEMKDSLKEFTKEIRSIIKK